MVKISFLQDIFNLNTFDCSFIGLVLQCMIQPTASIRTDVQDGFGTSHFGKSDS